MASKRTGVIIGLGEFGIHLAKTLSKDGCDVIVIDMNRNRIEQIKDFVRNAIIADVRQHQVLGQVIPLECDFVVVALGNIESSLICTLYLKELGVKKVLVKAVSDEHEKILKILNAGDIIFPEKDMGERLSAKLLSNNMLDYLPISGDYSIAEIAPLSSMHGKTLKDLDFRKKYDLSVIAIKELVPPGMIFSPQADFVIKLSDIMLVMGKKESIERYNTLGAQR